MFEKTMIDQLSRIFDIARVTFDDPSESQEEECLFIQVQKSKNTIKNGHAIARVTGKILMYVNIEKMPFGYLSKKIEEAEQADVSPFFFFDFEDNLSTYASIAQRSLQFVYFFNGQYNPEVGTLTSLNLQQVIS